MNQINWTETARSDLQSIYDFLARDSLAYADRMIERLILAAERLLDFPRSGRVVPELQNSSVREILVGGYWVVYRVETKGMTILTVLHGARQRPDLCA